MNTVFCIAAAVALAATALAVTRQNPVYALLNFVVSLLAMAVVFFTLGAPFAAALEVIVYAGAIMVLFLFVVMMLSLGRAGKPGMKRWPGPALALLLCGGLAVVLRQGGHAASGVQGGPAASGVQGGPAASGVQGGPAANGAIVSPQAVGQALFGRDVAAVELASALLLAGLIAAYHLGRKERRP